MLCDSASASEWASGMTSEPPLLTHALHHLAAVGDRLIGASAHRCHRARPPVAGRRPRRRAAPPPPATTRRARRRAVRPPASSRRASAGRGRTASRATGSPPSAGRGRAQPACCRRRSGDASPRPAPAHVRGQADPRPTRTRPRPGATTRRRECVPRARARARAGRTRVRRHPRRPAPATHRMHPAPLRPRPRLRRVRHEPAAAPHAAAARARGRRARDAVCNHVSTASSRRSAASRPGPPQLGARDQQADDAARARVADRVFRPRRLPQLARALPATGAREQLPVLDARPLHVDEPAATIRACDGVAAGARSQPKPAGRARGHPHRAAVVASR